MRRSSTLPPQMKTNEIALRLVALCREGQWKTAQQELFADDAVSIEPYATPGFEKETKGKAAIAEKGDRFEAMVETMHACTVSDPLVAGNSFACTMTMDVTMKGQPRMQMAELCVYAVKDGKVVSEQFFM
jgi:ketosteroid isomerase-like protein